MPRARIGPAKVNVVKLEMVLEEELVDKSRNGRVVDDRVDDRVLDTRVVDCAHARTPGAGQGRCEASQAKSRVGVKQTASLDLPIAAAFARVLSSLTVTKSLGVAASRSRERKEEGGLEEGGGMMVWWIKLELTTKLGIS